MLKISIRVTEVKEVPDRGAVIRNDFGVPHEPPMRTEETKVFSLTSETDEPWSGVRENFRKLIEEIVL